MPHRHPADRMADDALTSIMVGVGKLQVILVTGLIFGIVHLVRYLIPQDTSLKLPLWCRFEHMHVVAGSGHGKNQLLQHLIATVDLPAVVRGGRSVVVIDSQGDLLKNILSLAELSPERRNLSERLIYIDPNDLKHPPCLNLFDFGLDRLTRYDPLEREKLINGAIALYEYVFGALLGAELSNRQGVIFRYLARLMMVVPGATIHTLMQFMEDPEATRPYIGKLDRTSAHFFQTQFFSRSFSDTRQQILTRLWGVLSNTVLERMFGNERNTLDLFDAVNRGSLILINTAKDLLKQEGCEILGRFFIALIAQAAQERAAIPNDKRQNTFVYIDEAADYFDESIEHLLNQARKNRVGLILAHQNLDQFDERLRAAVMASTSIKLVGGLSFFLTSVSAPILMGYASGRLWAKPRGNRRRWQKKDVAIGGAHSAPTIPHPLSIPVDQAKLATHGKGPLHRWDRAEGTLRKGRMGREDALLAAVKLPKGQEHVPIRSGQVIAGKFRAYPASPQGELVSIQRLRLLSAEGHPHGRATPLPQKRACKAGRCWGMLGLGSYRGITEPMR